MKKFALICLVVILISGLIFSSCAEPAAPTPAPAPAPAPAQQPSKYLAIEPKPMPAPSATPAAPPEKVYRLKYNDFGPAHIDLGVRAREWAAAIEERTGGRVHIDLYFAEALLKRPDTIRGLEAGLADIALYVLGVCPGVHRLNRIIDLPGLAMPGQVAKGEIYQKLCNKYPEFEEEYGNTFPLFLRGMPPEHIHTTGKFHLVRVPEDMAGLKTYANAQWADQLNTVGAAYVNVQIMDWYTALNTNLVQGFMSHWLSVYSFGLVELLKYHSIVGESGLGMQSLCYLMNRDSFAELPADCQKIILDASKEWNAMALKEDDALTVQAGIDKAKELGNEVVYLTPEEQQQWQDFAKPIDEKWLAETEAAGYPQVREIYNDLKSMIAEY